MQLIEYRLTCLLSESGYSDHGSIYKYRLIGILVLGVTPGLKTHSYDAHQEHKNS